jgi:hypothetical protein
MARRRVRDDNEMVSILNVSHESSSDITSSDSDCKVSNADTKPRTATTEECATMVLSALSKSPRKSSRRLSAETGISQSSIARIVKEQKWHPYKLQMRQHLTEDDRTVPFNSVNGRSVNYVSVKPKEGGSNKKYIYITLWLIIGCTTAYLIARLRR